MWKKCLTIGIILLLTTMSTPISVSDYDYENNSLETNYITRFCLVSLKVESASLSFGFPPIGRLWLPFFPVQFYIDTGETELKINGKLQQLDYPVLIMLRGFFGIGPPININQAVDDDSMHFFGISRETIIIPTEVFYDSIYDQHVFDVYDIKDFGQTSYGLTSADFNDDGDVDFAVSYATSPFLHAKISLLYNDGNLGFTQNEDFVFATSYSYIQDLDSGDYNNDGDIDLLFTYSEWVWHGGLQVKINGVIDLLFNNGDNTFNNRTQIAWHGPGTPYDPENRINPQLASADFDIDGDIDFLVGDNSGKVEFYTNNGSGNFSSKGIIHDWGHVSWGLTADDFDGDSDIDFLVMADISDSMPGGYIYLKRNQFIESNFTTCFEPGPGEIIMTSSHAGSLRSFDCDNDSDIDFIAGINDHVYLCVNRQSHFDPYSLGNLPPSEQGYSDHLRLGGLSSSDYDNDGKIDFLTGGVQGVVRLYINNFKQIPPLRPSIRQPTEFHPNRELEFGFTAHDVNDDDIYYYIDWGNGKNTGWLGPYASGEGIDIGHIWRRPCSFVVSVKAKDDDGEGDWKHYILILFPRSLKGGVTSLELEYPFNDYYDRCPLLTSKIQDTMFNKNIGKDCEDVVNDYQIFPK
ncbi:MAG: VCBS repeat-containing protein [Thermoplasmatales archaeon]|nr:MAG: VCBS repeat-containing protein [Thermoplasmatales archaeon]